MTSFSSNIITIVAVCCCIAVSQVASAPTNVHQTNCSTLDQAGEIKRVAVLTQNLTPMKYKKDLSYTDKKVLWNAMDSMNKLFEQHATVSQLLFEEGENATDETRALSLVLNKTFELTCKWLSQQFESPGLDCSSPQDMKQSMLKISVSLMAQDIRETMRKYTHTRRSLQTDCDKWIECHIEQENDRQLLAQIC